MIKNDEIYITGFKSHAMLWTQHKYTYRWPHLIYIQAIFKIDFKFEY